MTTPAPASAPRHALDAVGECIAVLDFGSQTAQLIARRIRDAGVLAVLVRPDESPEALRAMRARGIVLSGGPASVTADGSPRCDPGIFDMDLPVLGICYGMQLIAHHFGGTLEPSELREFGRADLTLGDHPDTLLDALPAESIVWMSHGDRVTQIDDAFTTLASTPSCEFAAVKHRERPIFGVQFHPEVSHTACGQQLLSNFIYHACRCEGGWSMANFLEHESQAIRERVGDDTVICGLSGGVDSSVCAALLHHAIGDQLTCVFVDNGLLRQGERELVETTFKDHFHIRLVVADAADEFMSDLAGVTDPQDKRKRIGHRFIETFKHAAQDLAAHGTEPKFLAQGTLYPDVIESGHGHAGQSANIKLHHNVGGLPEELGFELIEPLRDLFKDEVRKLGDVLGLPDAIVWRHPFPGPGLAVRCLGEVTEDKLVLLRAADAIFTHELHAAGFYRKTAQAFAVLLPVQSVGVMGDGRTYERAIAIRCVDTSDFMTADWSRLPHELLARVSSRIINEVRGINRVVYDISSKPPATIEWE